MVRTTFSGQEILKVLVSFGYEPVSAVGSHRRVRYENPDTGEVRIVDVPLHDEVRIGTLRSIADQCGADDFEAWCAYRRARLIHRRAVERVPHAGRCSGPRHAATPTARLLP